MASNSSTPAGPTWQVIGQAERMKIGPTGAPVAVVEVTFKLADGTIGTVDVPAAAYTVDAVREAIAAKAGVLHAVSNLGGGMS